MGSSKKPTVELYMDRQTRALRPDDDILAAVNHLIDEGITGAPVVDAVGNVIGNLSEYDCLRLLAEGVDGERASGRVRDFMATDFTVVPPSMDIYFAAGLFLAAPHRRRFSVVDQGRLVGVVTRKDILRAVQAGLQRA